MIACLELHTYSSLNAEFLAEYKGALDKADKADAEHKDSPLEGAYASGAGGAKYVSILPHIQKLQNYRMVTFLKYKINDRILFNTY